jgi:hypothetical protein
MIPALLMTSRPAEGFFPQQIEQFVERPLALQKAGWICPKAKESREQASQKEFQ